MQHADAVCLRCVCFQILKFHKENLHVLIASHLVVNVLEDLIHPATKLQSAAPGTIQRLFGLATFDC